MAATTEDLQEGLGQDPAMEVVVEVITARNPTIARNMLHRALNHLLKCPNWRRKLRESKCEVSVVAEEVPEVVVVDCEETVICRK